MDEAIQSSPSEAPQSEATILADQLLQNCHQLLYELEEFQRFLAEKKDNIVDIRTFHSSVRSELKSLEKVSWFPRRLSDRRVFFSLNIF